MKQMTKTVATLAVAGIVCLSAAAFADAGEVRALGEAKISLTDAIKAAESYQGGRALDAAPTLLQAGDLVLDRLRRTVSRAGQTIDLQPTEFRLHGWELQFADNGPGLRVILMAGC